MNKNINDKIKKLANKIASFFGSEKWIRTIDLPGMNRML